MTVSSVPSYQPCYICDHAKSIHTGTSGECMKALCLCGQFADQWEQCVVCCHPRLRHKEDEQCVSCDCRAFSRVELNERKDTDIFKSQPALPFGLWIGQIEREHSAVNHPEHYNKHPSGVECIDIVEHFGFNIGSAIKYLWRAGLKDSATYTEDLEKAEWFIKRERNRVSKSESSD